MAYTLFSGCSFTAGSGFKEEKNNPELWVNLLHSYMFSSTVKLNVSKGSRSNAGIFQDTVKALVNYPVKYAFVQWTSMPRYELELGFELYPTSQYFIPNGRCRDHNTNQANYTEKYLSSIRDRFTSLAHDCYEIRNLIEYTNTIINLSKLTNTRVFFINGLCPWDKDFFIKKTNVLPDQYTEYTQDILHIKSRDDLEIFKLYDKMHNEFNEAGGINEPLWLNLYESMRNNRIDVNDDCQHPGVRSNQYYFELFSTRLREESI